MKATKTRPGNAPRTLSRVIFKKRFFCVFYKQTKIKMFIFTKQTKKASRIKRWKKVNKKTIIIFKKIMREEKNLKQNEHAHTHGCERITNTTSSTLVLFDILICCFFNVLVSFQLW